MLHVYLRLYLCMNEFFTIFQLVPMYQMPDYLTVVSASVISTAKYLIGAEAKSMLLQDIAMMPSLTKSLHTNQFPHRL